MADIDNQLLDGIQEVLTQDLNLEVSDRQLLLQPTKKEFQGDRTFVVFPFLKQAKMAPPQLGEAIGSKLSEKLNIVSGYNVVQGFLNIELAENIWLDQLQAITNDENYGFAAADSKPRALVEFSSPNTNKPLHLGHLRNIFLGHSVSEILKANGNKVTKVQIINDRGIHICKSMVAWRKYGEGETLESSGLKGDKLVGKYYVIFDQKYKEQIMALMDEGKEEEWAKKNAPIMIEARETLINWENKDPETYQLWETMNQWVYDGFESTYQTMGVSFDKNYYESDTYLLGKSVVMDGLASGIFYQKEDGSIWIDLTDDGLDQKLLLRSDGTAVYMTQDIGTAVQRFKEYPDATSQVYTVGNEQDYHFKVLFLVLKRLGYDWAEHCYHLSYGMVDLPSGKMKSREGTVVDADDIMQDMADTAKNITQELGKLDGMSDEDKESLYSTIGLGALKYFLLKVDPKKRLLFNPEESIDFNGHTAPFIQYTHARISSLLRKYGQEVPNQVKPVALKEEEINLIKVMGEYGQVVDSAAQNYSPALIANYVYQLVKFYNSFYQNCPVLVEENEDVKMNRLIITHNAGRIIKSGMKLLGINVPERM